MYHRNHRRLQQYLDSYGWRYYIDADNVIHSGWSSERRTFGLKVRLFDTLIAFEVELFSCQSLTSFYQNYVWESLLRVNCCVSGVRLGVDGSGNNVVMMAELYSADLSYDGLCRLLALFGFYGDRVAEDVIATMEELASTRGPRLCT